MSVARGSERRRPMVSVIIPVFRDAATVDRAIRSALAQSRCGEVLIVDDGADAQTRAAVATWVATEPQRVRVLSHPGGVNRGPGASRNLGLRWAREDYVGFLDADDELLPAAYDRSLDLLERYPRFGLAYSAVAVHFVAGASPVVGGLPPTIVLRTAGVGRRFCRHVVSGRHGGAHVEGLLIRRRVLGPDLCFDEALRLGEDVALWWRLSARVPMLAAHRRPVARHYRHAANTAPDGGEANLKPLCRVAQRCWRWSRRYAPQASSCLLFAWLQYAVGRAPDTRLGPWLWRLGSQLLRCPLLARPDLWLRKMRPPGRRGP